MTQYNMPQLRTFLREAGATPRQAKIGAAIALCESAVLGSDPPLADSDSIGDQELANSTWGYSYGLWQVRSLRAHAGTGQTRDAERLLDPEFNARSAFQIFKDWGRTWRAWSTYTDDSYKAYLQDLFPPEPGTYIVIGGDTLGKIAQKLPGNWDWADLARVNGIHSPYTIRPGRVLLLPTDEVMRMMLPPTHTSPSSSDPS